MKASETFMTDFKNTIFYVFRRVKVVECDHRVFLKVKNDEIRHFKNFIFMMNKNELINSSLIIFCNK